MRRARPRERHRLVIEHSGGTTVAGQAVFCAGLWSDRLAVACGAPADPRIVPFRGGYLRLGPAESGAGPRQRLPGARPRASFLGAHLTRNFGGEVLIGPSALMAAARDAYGLATSAAATSARRLRWPGTWKMVATPLARRAALELRHAASRRPFVAEAARMVPALRGAKATAGPAGDPRPGAGRDGNLVDDFVVHRTERAVHVRNAPSPAATSALALARLIADELEGTGT